MYRLEQTGHGDKHLYQTVREREIITSERTCIFNIKTESILAFLIGKKEF